MSIKYELTNFVLGVAIAHLVTTYVLAEPELVFIPASEVINEFWLFVILIVYKFITLLFDKVFQQKNVVKEDMLDRYIRNRFEYFYDKYKKVTYITNEDNTLWILLFAIMIFENYNRGKIIRKLENLKIRSGKNATVGIMQVYSDKVLSDEESIILAYEKLKYAMEGCDNSIRDEMQIASYAIEYNPDDDYAKSVAFIFTHLLEYLERHPRYKMEFFLNEPYHEEYEEEEEEVVYENEACYGEQYLTLGDVIQISGLSKEEIYEVVNEEKLVVYFNEEELQRVLEEIVQG